MYAAQPRKALYLKTLNPRPTGSTLTSAVKNSGTEMYAMQSRHAPNPKPKATGSDRTFVVENSGTVMYAVGNVFSALSHSSDRRSVSATSARRRDRHSKSLIGAKHEA